MTEKINRILTDTRNKLAQMDLDCAVRDATESALRSLMQDWMPEKITGTLTPERMIADLEELNDAIRYLKKQVELASQERPLLPLPIRSSSTLGTSRKTFS